MTSHLRISLPVALVAMVAFASGGRLLADDATQANADASPQVVKNLEAIGKAVNEYQRAYRRYPPPTGAGADGKPLLSWRVHVLRYSGDKQAIELAEKFRMNEPWDSEHNRKLIEEMPEFYKTPGSKSDSQFKTRFLAPRSKDSLLGMRPLGRSWKEVLDGTMRTILVVQVPEESAVIWTRPDDYELDEQNPSAGLSRSADGGLTVLFGDGRVRILPAKIPAAQLNAFYTCNGGETIDASVQQAVFGGKPAVRRRPAPPVIKRPPSDADNLHAIAHALRKHQDYCKNLPVANRGGRDSTKSGPALSWRVRLLPLVDEGNLYQQFKLDEPWDSEHNKKLIEKMPAVFKAPGSKAAAEFKTVYLTPRGDKTAFPPDRALRYRYIVDGFSQTIFVVEASDDRAVIWTKPDDYELDENNPMAGLVGLRKDGFLAAFGDGAVRFVDANTPPELANALFTRNGGERIPEKPRLVISPFGQHSGIESSPGSTPASKVLEEHTIETKMKPPAIEQAPRPSGGAVPN